LIDLLLAWLHSQASNTAQCGIYELMQIYGGANAASKLWFAVTGSWTINIGKYNWYSSHMPCKWKLRCNCFFLNIGLTFWWLNFVCIWFS